jgi:hypothetical protein
LSSCSYRLELLIKYFAKNFLNYLFFFSENATQKPIAIIIEQIINEFERLPNLEYIFLVYN